MIKVRQHNNNNNKVILKTASAMLARGQKLILFRRRRCTVRWLKKGPQKLSLLNLLKRDYIISVTCFTTLLQRHFKICLLFADFLLAAFPILDLFINILLLIGDFNALKVSFLTWFIERKLYSLNCMVEIRQPVEFL